MEVLCNLIKLKKIGREDTNVNFNTFAHKLIDEMFFLMCFKYIFLKITELKIYLIY